MLEYRTLDDAKHPCRAFIVDSAIEAIDTYSATGER